MNLPEFNSDQRAELLRLPFLVGLSVKKKKIGKKWKVETHMDIVENKGGS